MTQRFILASGSTIRKKLLQQAGLVIEVEPGNLDESAVRESLKLEGAGPRAVADVLAEQKARKISARHPEALVHGCDQVLSVAGDVLAKPRTLAEARDQLRRLRGRMHKLHAAAVLYGNAGPLWRHVGEARLTMRDFSDSYLEAYLLRNWPGVGESVGAYKLEEEGVRLFTRIDGSHFTILGLPLLELLNHLAQTGAIEA